MSGGHFDYKQYQIRDIAHSIESLIEDNEEYSEDTIKVFKKALEAIRAAYIYAKRIDWLVSGDDSEEAFHERLGEDLKEEIRDA